jgi:hypothetical protein
MKYSDFHKEGTTLLYVKIKNELEKMIGKLRPINQFITIFYGVKLS